WRWSQTDRLRKLASRAGGPRPVMMAAVPTPSRFKPLLLAFLSVVLVVVGTVSHIAWRQTVARPTVTITPAPRLIGGKTAFTVTAQAARGNIAVAEVRLVQGGARATAAKLEAPAAPRIDLPTVIEPRAIGIKEGGATLEVWARDDFWRPLRFEDRPMVSVPVTIDLTPPSIELLSATQY